MISQYTNLAKECVALSKQKGLTIRQALELFDYCKDYVLDSDMTDILPISSNAVAQALVDGISQQYHIHKN